MTELFDAIYAEVPTDASARLFPRNYQSGLALAGGAGGRTCFVSAPLSSLPDYDEWLAPAAAEVGVSLVRAEDFIAPGEALLAKIDAVIASVGCAVVELSSEWTSLELGMVLNRLGPRQTLVLVSSDDDHRGGDGHVPDVDSRGVRSIRRPAAPDDWPSVAEQIVSWMVDVLGPVSDPASVQNAEIGEIINLAGEIERHLDRLLEFEPGPRSLSRLIAQAHKHGLITGPQRRSLQAFTRLRNAVAHGVTPDEPRSSRIRVVKGAERVLEALRGQPDGLPPG